MQTSTVLDETRSEDSMTFTTKLPFYVVFQAWRIGTFNELVYCCVIFFALGVGHEFAKKCQLAFLQYHSGKKKTNKTTSSLTRTNKLMVELKTKPDEKDESKSSIWFVLKHFVDSLLHCTLLVWSYFLMLSVMTLNAAVVSSAVVGCTVGYFLFHTPSTKPSKTGRKGEEKVRPKSRDQRNEESELL